MQTPVSMSRIHTLWLRMAEIYGHRWTSAYGENAEQGAGLTWSKGLGGLTPRDIANGLSQALLSSDPWPPTLPQFRALCLGVPSLAAVTLAINNRNIATPFERLTWKNLDVYRLRMADANNHHRVIRDAYELAREHVMQGLPMPDAVVTSIAKASPEGRPATAETAALHIALAEKILNDEQAEEESES